MRRSDDPAQNLHPSRRAALAGAATSLALWSLLPRTAIAGSRDPRLLTVILRGGLDGLSLAAPIGDPDYVPLRQGIAIPAAGEGAGLPLDPLFVLNPNMPVLHDLYTKGQATVLHALATPYRGRSHFDGQDVLESGLAGVGRTADGWLNRALAGLPSGGAAAPRKGLAMGAVVPLVMRGAAPVLTWIPKTYNLPVRLATIARIQELYAITDPKLARAFAEGLEIDRLASTATGVPAKGPRPFRDFVDAAETAARFLSTPDGPRIGALSYNGWDTHANEGVIKGLLANRLAGLDAAIKVLHEGLAPVWRDTVIVIVTEFGRTARVNGTAGTDHGTGMAALLVGGAVKGGRVVTDWPGLADKALYEGRDLAPTQDLRAVLKGVLRDHLGVPADALARSVFPDSAGVAPRDGLLV